MPAAYYILGSCPKNTAAQIAAEADARIAELEAAMRRVAWFLRDHGSISAVAMAADLERRSDAIRNWHSAPATVTSGDSGGEAAP